MAQNTAQYTIKLNSSQFSQALDAMRLKGEKFDSTIGGINRRAKKQESIFGSLLKLNIYGAALNGAINLGSAMFETAKQADSLNKSLELISGSSQEFNKNTQFIKESADSMGLEITSATAGFKTFAAATMGTNLAGKQTRAIFASVANAATKLGVDSEATKGIFLALGQMMSKGKVSAEELRGQVAERLSGAFSIAADAMGMTTAQLDKMMSEGKIVSKDFLPKFAKALDKNFGDPVKANADSIEANTNRIKNVWTAFKSSSIEIFGSISKNISEFITIFKENLTELKQAFSPITDSVKMFKEQVFGASQELVNGATAADKFKAGIQAIGNLLERLRPVFSSSASFFGNIVSGFRKVSESIDGFIQRTEWAKSGLRGLLAAFVSGFTFIQTYVSEIFGGIADSIAALFDGDFGGVAKGADRIAMRFFKAGGDAAKAFEESYNAEAKRYSFGVNRKRKSILEQDRESGTDGKGKSILEQDRESGTASAFGDTMASASGASGSSAASKIAATNVRGAESRRPVNITVNIDKLIDKFETTISNLSASESEVSDMVSRALLTAVNDVNKLAM